MDTQAIGDILSRSLHNSFTLEPRRNDILQVFVPLFYEDGDMMDIFIRQGKDDRTFQICDFGKTLMRLSYTFDIDTPRKEKLLDAIVKDGGGSIDNGNIFIQSDASLLFENIMQLSQIISKVDGLRLSKRRSVRNLFYAFFEDFIESDLKKLSPEKDITPIPARDDLKVDYSFRINGRPFYLFGILGNDKALSSVISILSFRQANIPFTSIAVHSDFNTLPSSTQRKVMNVTDKQFYDLDSFRGEAMDYFNRVAV